MSISKGDKMLHTLSQGTSENHFVAGKEYWRPSVAYPYMTWRLFRGVGYKCVCGKWFKKKDNYDKHYRQQWNIENPTKPQIYED